MLDHDTIAAISTPPGTGAIAIIRISGDRALAIIAEIFSSKAERFSSIDWNTRSHEAIHGYIFEPGRLELIDEVVVIPYKGPGTYTGEDLVEINCHGSPVLTREILELCLRRGARLARPGEFTQRAFLSGRLDLTQAEAVLDLIQAKTTRQGRQAISVLKGHLGERLKLVREWLVELLARIVAGIDFPEEVGEVDLDDLGEVVARCKAELEKLGKTAKSGRFLRDGLKLAIVGKPNAGKSSLLNQLLSFERAIVTDIPGTTRDSIEELFEINGIPIILIDTAGIRVTEDKVERIGIERTQKAISESDLALMVVDVSSDWSREDDEVLKEVGGLPFILVSNKTDLLNGADRSEFGNRINSELSKPIESNVSDEQQNGSLNCLERTYVSAKTGAGIDELKSKIEQFATKDCSGDSGGSLNQRQAQLCWDAIAALELVETTIAAAMPQDCLATDLKTAINCLSEASGEDVSEELITEIFSRFCIGK